MKRLNLGLGIATLVISTTTFYFWKATSQDSNHNIGGVSSFPRPGVSSRPPGRDAVKDRDRRHFGLNVAGRNELFEANGENYAESIDFILRSATDERQQRIFLAQLAEFAGKNGQVATLQFLDAVDLKITGQLRGSLYTSALETLAEKNPGDAIKAAERLGIGRLKADALANIINSWAKNDMQAAAVGASGFEFPEERLSASRMFGLKIMEDINGGLAILSNGKVSEEIKSQVAQDVGRFWKGNVDELLKAIEKSDTKQVSAAIGEYSLTHARETLPVLLNRPELITNNIFNKLVGALASSDPRGSLELMIGSPEFKNKSDLVNGTFVTWLHQDSVQASQWLGTSNTPNRDVLVERLVGYLIQTGDSTSAQAWANSISDPDIHKRVDNRFKKQK